jgi:uncharacterized membrane protein YgaE (UPF0421/DUF939 family)
MTSRAITTPARWVRAMTEPSRLVLAGKTAAAVVVAWYLAPLLPIADDQYAYYAPLGVLVSMYPTVAESARSGLQALIGLAIGITLGLLGLAALFAGAPVPLILAVVLGVGMLFAGIPILGVGRGWVAIAALFVLLVSGRDPENFSLSYLMTMALGVVVGLVVNLVVAPPLYLDRAGRRLSELRTSLTAAMDSLADHVEEGTVDAETFDAAMSQLDQATADVRREVYEADESKKSNPRRARRRSEPRENLARLHALERSVLYVRDLADVLAERQREDDANLGRDVAPALAHAIRACGAFVGTPLRAEDSSARLEEANQSLERYLVTLVQASGGMAATRAEELTPAALLRRTIDVSLQFAGSDDG